MFRRLWGSATSYLSKYKSALTTLQSSNEAYEEEPGEPDEQEEAGKLADFTNGPKTLVPVPRETEPVVETKKEMECSENNDMKDSDTENDSLPTTVMECDNLEPKKPFQETTAEKQQSAKLEKTEESSPTSVESEETKQPLSDVNIPAKEENMISDSGPDSKVPEKKDNIIFSPKEKTMPSPVKNTTAKVTQEKAKIETKDLVGVKRAGETKKKSDVEKKVDAKKKSDSKKTAATTTEESSTYNSTGNNSNAVDITNESFIVKLHHILTKDKEASKSITWTPKGDAFMIHNKKKFEKEILPEYFRGWKYRFFLQRLKSNGFKVHNSGKANGALDYCSRPGFTRESSNGNNKQQPAKTGSSGQSVAAKMKPIKSNSVGPLGMYNGITNQQLVGFQLQQQEQQALAYIQQLRMTLATLQNRYQFLQSHEQLLDVSSQQEYLMIQQQIMQIQMNIQMTVTQLQYQRNSFTPQVQPQTPQTQPTKQNRPAASTPFLPIAASHNLQSPERTPMDGTNDHSTSPLSLNDTSSAISGKILL